MGNNNMASREMLSKILKTTIQNSLKVQQHPVKRVLSKNAPCIANVLGRKFSNSVLRKGGATGPVEQRTPAEIKEYVEKEVKENWVGFGFYTHDKYRDTVAGHICFFTCCLIITFAPWIWNYTPDYSLQNWAQREAFLLLKEREEAGIFPISKDFIDPEKINLPSDEELGDIDILI